MLQEELFIKRSDELTVRFFEILDAHLDEIVNGNETEMMELNEIAKHLFVSQKHLIKVINQTSGHHPCHFYMQKILDQAKIMMLNTDLSIAEIARRLTYDPSNFNKFFRKYTGTTPHQFRLIEKAKISPL